MSLLFVVYTRVSQLNLLNYRTVFRFVMSSFDTFAPSMHQRNVRIGLRSVSWQSRADLSTGRAGGPPGASKSWNNWFLLFAKANQILIIIYINFLVHIIFSSNTLHITKTNVGYVIIQNLKGTHNIHYPVSSISSSRSFTVHSRSRSLTDCNDVTSAVYQNLWFGVANEVLKYVDMSFAKGSKLIQGQKTFAKEENIRIN